MLLSKVSGTNNSIYQERYLTVSVHKKNIDEARTYFARVGTDIITHLSKLSSIGEELDAEQRLQIFRDFFRADEGICQKGEQLQGLDLSPVHGVFQRLLQDQ